MSARVEEFTLQVCPLSGDPGCLDCTEGQCDGLRFKCFDTFHQCTECGEDDVYGPLIHEEHCSLAPLVDPEGDPQPARIGTRGEP